MHSNSHPVEPEELMAYLDGELPVAQAAAAAEHLAHCRECQAVAADLQGVSRRLMTWQVEAPEQIAAPGLGAAMEEREARPKIVPARHWGWLRRWPWAVGLAGAWLVVLLLLPRPASHDLYSVASSRAQISQNLVAPGSGPIAMVPSHQISDPREPDATLSTNGPLIVYTAQLTLTTPEFAKTREALEALVARNAGHVAQLTVNSPSGSGRNLQATLRVPAAQLQAVIAEMRKLGHVESESQGGEEVTQQVTDLEARLANDRTTEQRLTEILRDRTGKISDVLEVEKEMGRVRGEIERMVAERKNLGDRVAFATVNVTITEEYKEGLGGTAPTASLQLRNSAVEGWRNLVGSLFGVAQFLLSAGPALIVWAALLFFPARLVWRRWRTR
jgi:hypothetical protein